MLLPIAILIAVACGVREHWNRLRDDDPEWQSLFWRWLIQGTAIPSAVWAIINLGIFNYFPPLVPNLATAQAAGQPWFPFWIDAAVKGAGFTVICWGAITYVWMIFVLAQEIGDTPHFRRSLLIVGAPMLALALILCSVGVWEMLPSAILVVLMPLTHHILNLVEKPAPVPTYGAAMGKINFGKYEQAELEVINQLEKKDNDFNGWMMLAELYATKYVRLDDAAQVVVDICRDPDITEVEAALACNKLADWQLELGSNPPAARAALDLLIQRAPGSHVAKMAEVRLKQMPRTREDLLDLKKPKSIRLPALRENFAEPQPDGASIQEASAEANRMSDRLRFDPNDFDARERLAILLAENLNQVSAGIDQLRLMMNVPEISPERAAKWLAQIAAWERHLNKNETKFRALLNEIVRKYPATTHAISAKRQLHLIEEAELQKTVVKANPAIPTIRLRIPEA